jgi:exportin-2 (importin alpha re-exporter)
MTPFLQLFRQTASLLLSDSTSNSASKENYALLAQAMILLNDIYYDFTCHDLPPAIEDSHDQFFAPNMGSFQAFLLWDPVELRTDVSSSFPLETIR